MQITLDGELFDRPSDEQALRLAELFLTAARDEAQHIVRTDPIYDPTNDRAALRGWLESRPARMRTACSGACWTAAS